MLPDTGGQWVKYGEAATALRQARAERDKAVGAMEQHWKRAEAAEAREAELRAALVECEHWFANDGQQYSRHDILKMVRAALAARAARAADKGD